MSNETYRQFDPWRPSPVKEISRRQIVETHYFNVDHVSYESNQIGSFERYFVQENNGDTVAVLAVTDDGMIPLVEQYRIANHRWTLEIPAGHANNPSERPTDVAKRKLAEEITRVSVEILGGSPESVDILITDVKRENWATGGKLWLDKQ